MTPCRWAACMARARARPAGRRRAGGCGVPSSLVGQAAAVDRTPARRRAGRRARRPRRSAQCWGAAAGPPPRPRCWKRASSSAPAWPPARIIFRATTRFSREVPGLVDDAHAAPAQLAPASRNPLAGQLSGRSRGVARAGLVSVVGSRGLVVQPGAASPGRCPEAKGLPARGQASIRRCSSGNSADWSWHNSWADRGRPSA